MPFGSVWFCLNCDDQAPWKSKSIEVCPSCFTDSGVMEAKRFMNMDEQNNCQAGEY